MNPLTARRHRLAVVALGSLALAATTGCSPSSELKRDTPSKRGIDAGSYVEDYDTETEDDAVTSATAPEASSAGGVPRPVAEPGLLDDNTFVDAGTSGFIETASDPRSTFGLDVDTGSYSVARTLLEQGLRPPKESVRVEEWVYSFDYHDEAPTEQDLGITVEQGPVTGAGEATRLVRVGINAREVADEDRPSAHLTLVVDTSGSMDIRERLGLVKSSLALLVDTMDDDDTLSIVSYGSEATPLLMPTEVSETDTILDAIDDLQPGGSTNLEAGLRTGYAQAQEAFRPDAINTVVLASDGVANVGVTGPGRLADQIADAGDDGIHLVTVGFGMGNYNDDLMEQLADHGDGFYAYVDTFAEAERLFVEDLTSTLTVVAADARVQVTFDEQQVESYRLLGYENRAIDDDDFTDMDADAGEVGAGHSVTALYEVALADGVEQDDSIGDVDLRWLSVQDDAPDQVTADIDLSDAAADTDALALAAAVADTAQLLKGVELMGERGVTLDSLAQRVGELDARDVDGSDELGRLIEAAQQAERPRP